MKRLERAGLYANGDELARHVQPRTYDYLAKSLGRIGIPIEHVKRCRPWFLVYMLGAAGGGPGLETYFEKQAHAKGRSIAGLESNDAHLQVFAALNDQQAEALLLLTFAQGARRPEVDYDTITAAWRRGDPDFLERALRAEFRDLPVMGDRLLTDRNRAWLPKIEGWLRSGKTYFVVAGAAHMGGPNGLPTMLRARGYQVEQW